MVQFEGQVSLMQDSTGEADSTLNFYFYFQCTTKNGRHGNRTWIAVVTVVNGCQVGIDAVAAATRWGLWGGNRLRIVLYSCGPM